MDFFFFCVREIRDNVRESAKIRNVREFYFASHFSDRKTEKHKFFGKCIANFTLVIFLNIFFEGGGVATLAYSCFATFQHDSVAKVAPIKQSFQEIVAIILP